jgi:putative ABC transport system permease protein
MFENYFKTTYRHLLKSKLNFVFKLGGLTLALFSFLVIAIYVSFQLSFDRYNDDYENIYRVGSEWNENGSRTKYAVVPTGIGPELKDKFPEVKSFARVWGTGGGLIKYNDKSFSIWGFASADSSIFDVLSFKFISGDRHALDHPGSVVLTQSLAKQIFGDEDPLNKSISFTDHFNVAFSVSAIIEDMPSNTHLNIKGLIPFNGLRDSVELAMDPWAINIDNASGLYLKLNAGSDPAQFESKAIPFIKKRLTRTEEGLEKDYSIYLQPIKDIYLSPAVYAEFVNKGNVVYVYIFSLLGIFLIVIASINYVNLFIADFHKRNKEIGVRKILGARKRHISFQVITETVLISLVALTISIFSLYLLFPFVQQYVDVNLRFASLWSPGVMFLIALTLFVLIVFSTAYPAYQLAIHNPMSDLKAGSGFGRNSNFGKSLLLAQFIISIICIAATFIVGQQIGFIQSKNPGYDRHNMIVVYMPDRYPSEKIPVIKDEFKKLAGVEAVSYSTFRIAGAGYFRGLYKVEIDGEMKERMLNEVFFDHDFFNVTGIPLVAGRSFDPNSSTDSHAAFIVNETAVREFGWKNPLGMRISTGFGDPSGEKWEGTIIGVVKDFNVYSLHKEIEPLVMRLPWSDWPGQCVHIKVNGPLDDTIALIKAKYEEVLPGFVLNYQLIENIYDSQYEDEQKAFTTLQISTWVIVLISSLGIFSLSVYISLSRMKEFGIRKVLGASSRQIASLHVGYFIKVALLANAIALPIVYWLMKEWLDGFAYRTELDGVVFFVVMLISLLLVIISAGYSSLKAGRMNPVEVIKIQ